MLGWPAVMRTTGIGASRPLTSVPAKVASQSRQRSLSGRWELVFMPQNRPLVSRRDGIFRSLGVERVWMLLGIDEMRSNMLLNHFRHQSGDRSAHASDQVHHLFASHLSL